MCPHQVSSYGLPVSTENPTNEGSSASPAPGQDGTGRYEIRVKGHLGARWVAWFDGMTLTTLDDGTTLIEGPVVDQAALHGLLQKLRDLGIPLISLTPIPLDTASQREKLT